MMYQNGSGASALDAGINGRQPSDGRAMDTEQAVEGKLFAMSIEHDAAAIMAGMKARAAADPQRFYAHAWATTCLIVDAYPHGRGGALRYVWRMGGRRVKASEAAAEVVELLTLKLAKPGDCV